MEKIADKIKNRTASICVVGLGYVGLPLAVEAAKAGFSVTGFDISAEKVRKINRGENYISDINDKDLKAVVESGNLRATDELSLELDIDCFCISVPTPLDKYQQPDVTYIKKSVETILPLLKKGMLIILESTTYPGTTQDLVLPLLESTGLKGGVDFHLSFSPERIDPGNTDFTVSNTPKIVGGITPECTKVTTTFYKNILESEIHEVSSPTVAEMEKILENIYRNVNIGLVNELAILCNQMNIDIWEVIEAAKTKPYGFQAFYPGPGLGGHCIPLDPHYLSWKAKEYNFHTSMIETSVMINNEMPAYCVLRISKILNKSKKSLNGSKILLLGVAYKADIDDYRESPALPVLNSLTEEGAEVIYFDPYINKISIDDRIVRGEDRLTKELLESVDLVVITTAHSEIDYDFVLKNARSVFDTRNAAKNVIDKKDNFYLL